MKTNNDTLDLNESEKDDETISSCDTRRRIEDIHELRRYKDELGVHEDAFDLI